MKKLFLSIGVTMVLAATSSANDINSALNTLEGNVQDNEGNVYRTVQIGDQVWMAENLRSTKYQDGSKIKTAAIPKDDDSNLLKYGRLYDWHDVADERNLCPEGWRVATDEDWKELERTIGMSEEDIGKDGWRGDNDIAIQLKESQPDSLFKSFDQSQVNKQNFFARPAGVKWKGFYITQGVYTEFWTGTKAKDDKAFIRTLAYSWWNPHKGEIRRTTSSKDYMFSVRCIKVE
ncbi:fibrobacter succinogenes major paralogous domain-containing protein [Vibrio chaetopteri]|uniref:Fibrobacter succinogenes major paralogous domain-containing protein n=1 Tax=Vibrio chaetopteri TaxID=3016528 RepID=A0AAU8BRH1_9VIBR